MTPRSARHFFFLAFVAMCFVDEFDSFPDGAILPEIVARHRLFESRTTSAMLGAMLLRMLKTPSVHAPYPSALFALAVLRNVAPSPEPYQTTEFYIAGRTIIAHLGLESRLAVCRALAGRDSTLIGDCGCKKIIFTLTNFFHVVYIFLPFYCFFLRFLVHLEFLF
jgi:hypothetical protein